VLVSLAAVRPWRRCFSATGKMAVRCAPDDRALKRESSSVSFGAVEAGALMESIDGACCSEPPTSSPTTRIAVDSGSQKVQRESENLYFHTFIAC
jgi:hypothetical protein